MTYPSTLLYPSSTTFPNATPAGVQGMFVQLGDLVLTGTDPFGVEWYTESPLVGWDGSPPSSRTSTQKTRGAGSWSGPRNSSSRSIVLTGKVYAPTPDALQDALDRLDAAVTFQDTVLTITRGVSTRSAIVARQDEVLVADVTDVVCTWSVQLAADDPRKFTAAVANSTALPSSAGGFTFPLTFPLAIGSTSVSGRVTLTNPGNATGPVVLRIDGGPISGPTVTHLGSGLTLTFGTSLNMGAGEFLVVDMEAQTAYANGQPAASRSGYITNRGWSGFERGVNTWSFSAASGSGQLTVVATPAWL